MSGTADWYKLLTACAHACASALLTARPASAILSLIAAIDVIGADRRFAIATSLSASSAAASAIAVCSSSTLSPSLLMPSCSLMTVISVPFYGVPRARVARASCPPGTCTRVCSGRAARSCGLATLFFRVWRASRVRAHRDAAQSLIAIPAAVSAAS